MSKSGGSADDINRLCVERYELLKEEISSAILDGVGEGIKEGTRSGFLDGLKECFDIGFLKLRTAEVSDVEEMLKEIASDAVQRKTRERVSSDICPHLEARLNELCQKAITDLIKKHNITSHADIDAILKELKIKKILQEKVDSAEKKVKDRLPPSVLLSSILDGLMEGLSKCLNENVDRCVQKIEDALQRKAVEPANREEK